MPQINEKQAKEFLNSIKPNDKIAIIHDNDADGFTSGLLFYDFCSKKTNNISHKTFIRGRTKLAELNLKDKNKIIITDIAPNFFEGDLNELKGKEVFYLDHHPKSADILKEILELRTISKIHCARKTYDILKDSISIEKEWVLLFALFADMGYLQEENLKEARQYLKKYNLNLEESKEIVYQIGDFLTYFYGTPDKAFDILLKINSLNELNKIKKYSDKVEEETNKHLEDYKTKKEKINNINYFNFNPKFFIKSKVTTMLSDENPDETYIFTSPNGNKIGVSARNQSRKQDVAELLKKCIKDFKESTAGGHSFSAGATILAKDLEKFKENLKKFSENQK